MQLFFLDNHYHNVENMDLDLTFKQFTRGIHFHMHAQLYTCFHVLVSKVINFTAWSPDDAFLDKVENQHWLKEK